MIILLAFLSQAWASQISLQGPVQGLQRDPAGGYLVAIKDTSQKFRVSKGPSYTCLRESLTTQESVTVSFDSKTLRIQNCEKI